MGGGGKLCIEWYLKGITVGNRGSEEVNLFVQWAGNVGNIKVLAENGRESRPKLRANIKKMDKEGKKCW